MLCLAIKGQIILISSVCSNVLRPEPCIMLLLLLFFISLQPTLTTDLHKRG